MISSTFVYLDLRRLGIGPSSRAHRQHVDSQRLAQIAVNPARCFVPSTTVTLLRNNPILTMAVDPSESKYLLFGTAKGALGLYAPAQLDEASRNQIPNIQPEWITRPHTSGISKVCWYPTDSGLFLSGSTDCQIYLWDTMTLTSVMTLELKGAPVLDLAMGVSNSHLVAVATEEPHLRLCDLVSGVSTHQLYGHTSAITSIAWSPHSCHEVVTGSRDGSLRLWDVRKSGHQACLSVLNAHGRAQAEVGNKRPRNDFHGDALPVAHRRGVTCVCYSTDGRAILSSGHDRVIRKWDSHTGEHTFTHFPTSSSLGSSSSNDRANGRHSMKWTLAPLGDTDMLFYSIGSGLNQVGMYPIDTGRQGRRCFKILNTLCSRITAMTYRPHDQVRMSKKVRKSLGSSYSFYSRN